MNLGFVGTGEITSAIVTGLGSSNIAALSIRLSPRNPATAAELASRFSCVAIASSNQDVLDSCEVVMIAVRPQVAAAALSELRFRPDHHVISVVSALPLRSVCGLVTPASKVTRAVPLPSTANRIGPTAIYPFDSIAVDVFAAIGSVFPVKSETEFDAICAATATISSYYAFAERIASWLIQTGVPQTIAREYVACMFWGLSSASLDEPDYSFQSLASKHATAGGINEQFLSHLAESGFLDSISHGLNAVMQRITTTRQE